MDLNDDSSTKEIVQELLRLLDELESSLRASFPIEKRSSEEEKELTLLCRHNREYPEGFPAELITIEQFIEKASDELQELMRPNEEGMARLRVTAASLLERITACKERVVVIPIMGDELQAMALFTESSEAYRLSRDTESFICEFVKLVNSTLSGKTMSAMGRATKNMCDGIKAYGGSCGGLIVRSALMRR